jgi:hypothetical protein
LPGHDLCACATGWPWQHAAPPPRPPSPGQMTWGGGGLRPPLPPSGAWPQDNYSSAGSRARPPAQPRALPRPPLGGGGGAGGGNTTPTSSSSGLPHDYSLAGPPSMQAAARPGLCKSERRRTGGGRDSAVFENRCLLCSVIVSLRLALLFSLLLVLLLLASGPFFPPAPACSPFLSLTLTCLLLHSPHSPPLSPPLSLACSLSLLFQASLPFPLETRREATLAAAKGRPSHRRGVAPAEGAAPRQKNNCVPLYWRATSWSSRRAWAPGERAGGGFTAPDTRARRRAWRGVPVRLAGPGPVISRRVASGHGFPGIFRAGRMM